MYTTFIDYVWMDTLWPYSAALMFRCRYRISWHVRNQLMLEDIWSSFYGDSSLTCWLSLGSMWPQLDDVMSASEGALVADTLVDEGWGLMWPSSLCNIDRSATTASHRREEPCVGTLLYRTGHDVPQHVWRMSQHGSLGQTQLKLWLLSTFTFCTVYFQYSFISMLS